MDSREKRVFEWGRRVIDFFSVVSLGDPRLVTLRRRLTASLERVSALWVQQNSPITGARKRISELRRDLRRAHLLPISRTGRGLFRDEPRVLIALKVPHARVDAETLVSAALAMAKALQPHKALFIEDGYRKDFLVQLRGAALELKKWSSESNSKRAARAIATAKVRGEMAELRRTLSIIDSIVPSLVEHDRGKAAAWAHARRHPGKPGRPRAKKGASRPVEVPAD